MATNLSGDPVMNAQREKRVAAEAAADLVGHGMTVGRGTGSTVAFLLPPLAHRSLNIRCVATSPSTEHAARELGLRVEDFTSIERFDIAIDGVDHIRQRPARKRRRRDCRPRRNFRRFGHPSRQVRIDPRNRRARSFPRHMATTALVAR